MERYIPNFCVSFFSRKDKNRKLLFSQRGREMAKLIVFVTLVSCSPKQICMYVSVFHSLSRTFEEDGISYSECRNRRTICFRMT